MSNQPFTVTLPSNSNMQAYPTNRGSKYVVKLSAPLNFTGQTLNDDVMWEAALTSLQYTNRFYDVRERVVVHVAVQFPNIRTIDVHAISTAGLTQFSENLSASNIKGLPAFERRALKQFVKTAETADATFVVYGKIVVDAGHYKNASDIYNRIMNEFNRMYGPPRYNTKMNVSIKGTDGMIQFHLDPPANKLFLFTDKPIMVNTLGLSATLVDSETPALYQMALAGTKTPRFDTVQSLYTYCDIIKPQHVGDTLAPLLEIVPVQGIPGQRIHYSVNQVTYLPVNRTYIESINIEICDEYGNPVTFADDVENVVCRLRFRRSKPNGLML